jgi:outer membrane protein assembly factor BamB
VWQRRVLGRALWSALYGGTDPDSPFLGQPAWDAARGQLVVSQAQFGSTSDPSHGVIALRPGSGCRRWSLAWAVDIGGGSQPPPLVLGDVVIATTPAGDAYAISAAKGSIVWSAKPGPTVAPVATDGRAIFVAGLDGRVHAYAPRGFTAP